MTGNKHELCREWLTRFLKGKLEEPQEQDAQEMVEYLCNVLNININGAAMARSLNIDSTHVSKVLSGKSKPSLTLARHMSAYLDIPMDDLCDLLGINGVGLRRYDRSKGSPPPE